MTAAEALELIRGYAKAGRIAVSSHARKRMQERNVRQADIASALGASTSCRASQDGAGRWAVSGPDLDGQDLTVVVVIQSGVVVVTVF